MTELEAFEPVNVGGTDADSQSSADHRRRQSRRPYAERATVQRTTPAPSPAAVAPPKSAPQSQPLLQEL